MHVSNLETKYVCNIMCIIFVFVICLICTIIAIGISVDILKAKFYYFLLFWFFYLVKRNHILICLFFNNMFIFIFYILYECK